MPVLDNVRSEFLPANMASMCQLMDAEYSASVKNRLRRRQLQLNFDNIMGMDMNSARNRLTALRCMGEIWNTVDSPFIQN